MNINFDLGQVECLKQLFLGDSKPISVVESGDSHQSVEWWLQYERNEGVLSPRQAAGLALYVLLSSGLPQLRTGEFPAVFNLCDGEVRRPDKGIIKAALEGRVVTQVLDPLPGVSELIFRVVPEMIPR